MAHQLRAQFTQRAWVPRALKPSFGFHWHCTRRVYRHTCRQTLSYITRENKCKHVIDRISSRRASPIGSKDTRRLVRNGRLSSQHGVEQRCIYTVSSTEWSPGLHVRFVFVISVHEASKDIFHSVWCTCFGLSNHMKSDGNFPLVPSCQLLLLFEILSHSTGWFCSAHCAHYVLPVPIPLLFLEYIWINNELYIHSFFSFIHLLILRQGLTVNVHQAGLKLDLLASVFLVLGLLTS